MATETVGDTTVPNHDETETEPTEFEKNQKRYQDLIPWLGTVAIGGYSLSLKVSFTHKSSSRHDPVTSSSVATQRQVLLGSNH